MRPSESNRSQRRNITGDSRFDCLDGSVRYLLSRLLSRRQPATFRNHELITLQQCTRSTFTGERPMVKVAVDVSKCNGDSICADVCPVAVFELQEVKGYDGKKSVVVNNDACIVCRACEVQCPTQAITVTE